MTVNHFGPYTFAEELQMRVDTLNNEIRHHGEKIIELQKDIASRKTEQRRLEGLRDEYEQILRATEKVTPDIKADTETRWREPSRKPRLSGRASIANG